ncbi:hypothetical protein JOS77_03890 [Chromobacterium haemolyticum]|nr:hypothetical protein JOS77_03890 [Chromobacterium haemolyticum]
MLLGLTASNRLETAKIALLLQWLEQHAGLLRVEQLDQPLGDDGALAFRADADRPARFCAELDLDGDGVWWRLDAGRLLERLDELSRQRQRQGLDGGHETWLLARLRQEWGAPPRRRHVRLRRLSVETVELVSLLPRCWRLAAGEPADGELEPCRLQISNLSASGLLLQGESLQQPLRAGEVVMLRRRGFGWQLGLVRWVSFGGEDMQTECGGSSSSANGRRRLKSPRSPATRREASSRRCACRPSGISAIPAFWCCRAVYIRLYGRFICGAPMANVGCARCAYCSRPRIINSWRSR